MLLEKIINHFKKSLSFKSFDKFLKDNDDVRLFLEGKLLEVPWFRTLFQCAFCLSRGIKTKVFCENCGKEIPAKMAAKGRRFCSSKCSNGNSLTKNRKRATMVERYGEHFGSNPEILKKRIHTNVEKFGCAVPIAHNLEVLEKKRNTNLEKYGCEELLSSPEIRGKMAETNLQRYGTVFPSQNSEIKERIKRTFDERYGGNPLIVKKDEIRKKNLERYGFECHLSSPEVQERIRKSNICHFGADNPFKDGEIKERIRKTNLERYGVENPLLNSEVRDKSRQTNLERYGCENAMMNEEVRSRALRGNLLKSYDRICNRWKDEVVPLFSKEEYLGFFGKEKVLYRWRCVHCGREFEQVVYHTSLNGVSMAIPRCWNCHPMPNDSGTSFIEQSFIDFLKEICGEDAVSGRSHGIIGNLELDAYIAGKNTAFEFDGLYWHSEECGKDSSYHLRKTELCEKKGIRLIHVFEDEWVYKREIVKDRIRAILGCGGSRRIHARRCEVREVSVKESNLFLEENHLQGGGRSDFRYGLFLDGELVSVMTFGKPRFNKNYDWELIRFASKIGTSVIGGASRLLVHFRKSHRGSIVSYADRRWSDGRLYEAIGFRLVGTSKPNYWYTKNRMKLSRYQCQKHLLPKLLGDGFNPALSESENMLANGYSRIYDCGNLVYHIGN